MSLEQNVQEIKIRNQRVEADKAWETSWTRAFVIAFFTYLTAGIWLVIIQDSNPWFKALVPAAGFLFSTTTLPAIKRYWIRVNIK